MVRLESRRSFRTIRRRIDEDPVERRRQRHTQPAMIVVSHGDKPKWLQAGAAELVHGRQHLGHPLDSTSAGVESDLHKVARGQSVSQFEQASGQRQGLQFGALVLAAFRVDRSPDGSVQLYAWRTLAGVGLGSHSQKKYATTLAPNGRLPKHLYTSVTGWKERCAVPANAF